MPNLMHQHTPNHDYIQHAFTNTGDFEELLPVTFPKRRHETAYIRYAPPNTFVKLVDNAQNDAVTIITLAEEFHAGKLYDVIKLTRSSYPQRGHLKYLLLILIVDYDYNLMSDELHTLPGSMNVWKKIKMWQNIQTRIINIASGYVRRYVSQKDSSIWGLGSDLYANGQINTYAVEDLKKKGRMSSEFYDFILKNQDEIADRQNIRLIAQK